MKRLIKTLLVVSTILFLSSSAWASGTIGGGGFGNYNRQAPQRQIDENYEYGKSIYQGRLPDTIKYSYCVEVSGEKVPLKRKHLKQFKNGDYVAFANGLFDCERPDQLIGLEMKKEQFQYVLYYLNKRYKLNLSTLSGV